MKIYEHYALQSLNTLGLTVQARYFCILATLSGLSAVWRWQQQHPDLPVLFLGGGSNVVFVSDFSGLVVQVKLMERTMLGDDQNYHYIRAGAGENWHDFVVWTLAQGYAGLENLSLIPGTVGAAPVQNIGAYGVELKDHLYEVVALDWRTAELRHFSRAECQFAYRESYFKSVEPERWLIASVTFQLPKQPQWHLDYAGVRERLPANAPISAQAISDAIIQLRQSKLPDPSQLGNVGSFFKNPLISISQYEKLKQAYPTLVAWVQGDHVKLSAGWLIDQCGWKGRRSGQVGTYAQHALVLVNYGGATGQDIWQFAQAIIASVQAQFGVILEPEPKIIRSTGECFLTEISGVGLS